MFRTAALSSLAILCAACLAAETVPAGVEVSVRLLAPISSATAKVNDPVSAVTIGPTLVNDKVLLPAGVRLTGTVTEVKKATPSTPAELTVHFTKASSGTVSAPINASIAAIDNVRETVDDKGRIVGIVGGETYSSRIDQGVAKLANNSKLSALASLIQGAKQQLNIQEADPEIAYEAGTEFTVKLNSTLNWKGSDEGPFGKVVPITPASELIDLVNRQPFRTVAENPPRPSDITNLMFLGTESQVRAAFEKAGWSAAAKLSSQSKMETARAIIEGRGYKEGPMSVLLLDGNAPALVFQKTNNTFAQRHHLRIYRRPDTFQGMPVWVCSSTHDVGIAFSESDRTFIHKIDSDIDKERRKVVEDLIFTGSVSGLALVDRPSLPKNLSNATGDSLTTDGKMAVLQLGS